MRMNLFTADVVASILLLRSSNRSAIYSVSSQRHLDHLADFNRVQPSGFYSKQTNKKWALWFSRVPTKDKSYVMFCHKRDMCGKGKILVRFHVVHSACQTGWAI